jgi:superoxide dismutase, Fe-Mn family
MLTKVIHTRLQSALPRRLFANVAAARIVQTPLPYELNALEPVLTQQQMDYHYNRHHKTYVVKYNEKLDQIEAAWTKKDYQAIARIAREIRFFGGGNWNHTFFWESLAPTKAGGGERPGDKAELTKLIKATWGSYDAFISAFNTETAGIQGSGWGWLVYNRGTKSLEYRASANQDLITDQQPTGLVPLLNIDIWEHAFYIDYKHAKADFLKDIWKVVNWQKVEHRLNEAHK